MTAENDDALQLLRVRGVASMRPRPMTAENVGAAERSGQPLQLQ